MAKTIRIDIRPSHVAGYTEVIKITNGKVIEVLGNRKTQADAREYAQQIREAL